MIQVFHLGISTLVVIGGILIFLEDGQIHCAQRMAIVTQGWPLCGIMVAQLYVVIVIMENHL